MIATETTRRLDPQLDRAMPGWRAIVADANWARWLDAANPATGLVRRDQFNDAIERGDIRVVVASLQRFQQEQREGWPIREIGQEWQPRAAAPTYTRAQIEENYRQHQRGAWVGREEEWMQLEADFIRAAREGRISNPVPLAKNFGDGR